MYNMRPAFIKLSAILAALLMGGASLFAQVGSAGDAEVGTGPGSVASVDGVTVLTVSGTPREMGRQHGLLLGNKLLDTEAAFQKILPPLPGGALGKWLIKRYVMYQAGSIEKLLTDDEVEEMKGIADTAKDKKGAYDDLLYYHVLHDIGQNFACTGGAAAGRSSRLAGPVAGRNFDFDNRGKLDEFKTVVCYLPKDGQSFVSVAWPGMVGAVSGMNEHGLCLMVFSARSNGTSLKGVPVAFLARRVLCMAEDIPQAVEIIKNTPRMGPDTFLLVDKKSAAVVEFDSGRVGVREVSDGILPVANHFFTEGLASDDKNVHEARYTDSRQRYERMETILKSAGRIGIDEMLSALRDHKGPDGGMMAWGDPSAVNNFKDAHSVIFDPAGMRFWVSTKPYACGKFIGFRLTRTGLARVRTLPEDAYPESEEGLRARESDDLMVKANDAGDISRSQEARGLTVKALTVDPHNYLAALSLGYADLDEYHYDAALKAFDKAVASAPSCSKSMALALSGRGEALTRLGKKKEAKSDFKAALGLDCCKEASEAAERGLAKL